jgi:transposase-like protein
MSHAATLTTIEQDSLCRRLALEIGKGHPIAEVARRYGMGEFELCAMVRAWLQQRRERIAHREYVGAVVAEADDVAIAAGQPPLTKREINAIESGRKVPNHRARNAVEQHLRTHSHNGKGWTTFANEMEYDLSRLQRLLGVKPHSGGNGIPARVTEREHIEKVADRLGVSPASLCA